MFSRAVDLLDFAYLAIEPKVVEFWHVLPVWVRVVTTVTLSISSVIAILQIALGRRKLKKLTKDAAERGFNVAYSISHNFGNLIGDTFAAIALFVFGWSSAEKMKGNHTIWFWITLTYSIYRAVKKHVRVTTTGREFKIFFENRSAAAQAVHLHNEKYPPTPKQGFNYRASTVTRGFVQDILENHLDFLHRTLRLGFSWHGKDNYSASILIFDAKKQEWHKWLTVYEPGIKPSKVRKGSSWPLPADQFKLPQEMYRKDRPRGFDVQQHKTGTYSSFLTIPLYFRRNGQLAYTFEKAGDIFGAISYTNSNPETFENLTADKFIKYFALEMAVIERLAFRVYRDYTF